MPLYEYKCLKCGDLFEVIQRFSDDPLSVHEECGGAVERLVSAPALQFKGSGWYITDYAKGNGASNSPGANGSANNDSSGGSGESKSDSGSGKSATPASSPASTATSSGK
ncbi:MAG: FmdB family zinc ribbon protein [Bryobacteraceae bacterium]